MSVFAIRPCFTPDKSVRLSTSFDGIATVWLDGLRAVKLLNTHNVPQVLQEISRDKPLYTGLFSMLI